MTLTSSTSRQAIPSSWVERLFDRMLLTYGKKFTDQWGGADPDKLIAHWAQELGGFSNEEIKRGYDHLEARDWPPTLPEFKKMCRPPLDATLAYYEAMTGIQARDRGEVGVWSHPAVYWAMVKIGAYDMLNFPYSQVRTRWESIFADEMEKGAWADIPKPMLALPAPGTTKTDKEAATKMLQQLGAGGVLKSPEGKRDHKAWIKRAMERKASGDKTLPDITFKFAKEAMKEREA
jgi:hypothetical protein